MNYWLAIGLDEKLILSNNNRCWILQYFGVALAQAMTIRIFGKTVVANIVAMI